MSIFLSSTLTASARVGTGAPATFVADTTIAAPFPLSVRQASANEIGGRIVGRATIVNVSNAAVRPTTGSLGLGRGTGSDATALLTFSVGTLPAHGSKTVRFRSSRTRSLGVGSGVYTPLICTDVYSQVQRFEAGTHCARGASLTIAADSRRQTGPSPDTRIATGLAKVTTNAAVVLRFGATIARSSFQCSLDGGPWVACRSPKRYAGLVDGAHTFRVRALSRTGVTDPSPARASWTVDRSLPSVNVTTPLNGSTVKTDKPTFSGAAGTAAGDASAVTVHVFAGPRTSGLPVQTLTAGVSAGQWSVASTRSVPNGTYTADVEQADRAGNRGVSAPRTFSVEVTQPANGHGTVSTDDESATTSTTSTTATTTTPTTSTATTTTSTTTTTQPPPPAGSDGFDRADGGLGSGWEAMSDGGLSIASDVVVGTAGATDGDLRVGEL
ncbi:MAG TPA: Ig-like domain-containing protein, partial [Solirubrobacteraceae bacterium]